jgi:hypothetical protein
LKQPDRAKALYVSCHFTLHETLALANRALTTSCGEVGIDY